MFLNVYFHPFEEILLFQDTISGLRLMTDDPRNYVFNLHLRSEAVSISARPIVGNCCLRWKAEENGHHHYEIGYWLHGGYTGRGLTTECVKGLIKFARSELGAFKLSLYVNEGNFGSKIVAEKSGFTLVRNEVVRYDNTRPDWGIRVNHYFEMLLRENTTFDAM